MYAIHSLGDLYRCPQYFLDALRKTLNGITAIGQDLERRQQGLPVGMIFRSCGLCCIGRSSSTPWSTAENCQRC